MPQNNIDFINIDLFTYSVKLWQCLSLPRQVSLSSNHIKHIVYTLILLWKQWNMTSWVMKIDTAQTVTMNMFEYVWFHHNIYFILNNSTIIIKIYSACGPYIAYVGLGATMCGFTLNILKYLTFTRFVSIRKSQSV